jgi:DNA-3-methyladenine glycosylase I
MNNPAVIRNRAKILATINNARRFKEIREDFGSFAAFVWQFVGGKHINHAFLDFSNFPSESEESRAMSKELKIGGLSSSDQRFAMPSCKPSAWLTIT